MGTNFYWKDDGPKYDAEYNYLWVHLGKRSAAGRYCFDCRRTLCEEGEQAIHSGHGRMLTACPDCGATSQPKAHSAVGVELGWTSAATVKLTGVQGASSFTWASDPAEVRQRCEQLMDRPAVQDEYERNYTGAEFLQMLAANCPIEFTNMLGRRFS